MTDKPGPVSALEIRVAQLEIAATRRRRRTRRTGAGLACLALMGAGLAQIVHRAAPAAAKVFNLPVGQNQQISLPVGTRFIHAELRGAQGGGAGAAIAGGKGALVRVSLAVNPNQALFVDVGGVGG